VIAAPVRPRVLAPRPIAGAQGEMGTCIDCGRGPRKLQDGVCLTCAPKVD